MRELEATEHHAVSQFPPVFGLRYAETFTELDCIARQAAVDEDVLLELVQGRFKSGRGNASVYPFRFVLGNLGNAEQCEKTLETELRPAPPAHTTQTTTTSVSSAPTAVVLASETASASSAPTAVVTGGGCTGPNCGVNWPASYLDGPLGQNEVLPKSKGGVLLGLWSGVTGYNTAQERSFLQQRISDMGRTPDIVGFQSDNPVSPGNASLDVSSTELSENWIHSLGAVPFISWYPDGTYAQIAAGNSDSEIDTAATRFKTFGHRIMVRMFQEFDHGNPGSWNITDFINAWRHIVNRFAADGATNVGFVWEPTSRPIARPASRLTSRIQATSTWTGSRPTPTTGIRTRPIRRRFPAGTSSTGCSITRTVRGTVPARAWRRSGARRSRFLCPRQARSSTRQGSPRDTRSIRIARRTGSETSRPLRSPKCRI